MFVQTNAAWSAGLLQVYIYLWCWRFQGIESAITRVQINIFILRKGVIRFLCQESSRWSYTDGNSSLSSQIISNIPEAINKTDNSPYSIMYLMAEDNDANEKFFQLIAQ